MPRTPSPAICDPGEVAVFTLPLPGRPISDPQASAIFDPGVSHLRPTGVSHDLDTFHLMGFNELDLLTGCHKNVLRQGYPCTLITYIRDHDLTSSSRDLDLILLQRSPTHAWVFHRLCQT
ncbi:UNVERIFIED_CONTAM: hypothetical protein Slati_4561000 [Sesamum latifolium]|uniref:Uncharacterized protein n=1 Tax=Sesamum latifolium TaxID=2727402 RepID=A0AAW2S1P5_9LAMI